MAVNFPSNPINGDTFTVGTKIYTYDAVADSWERQVATATQTSDARTLEGYPGSYYLDYTNLTNVPAIALDVSDLTDDNSLLFDGQYSSLIGVPSIPTDVADLTDTTGRFNDFDGSYNSLTDLPTLFSGSWNDLTDKPTIPTNIPDDVSDLTDNLNIIFSGNYDDLGNKPNLYGIPNLAPADIEDGQALIWSAADQQWTAGNVATDSLANLDGGRADTDFTSSVMIVLDGGNA